MRSRVRGSVAVCARIPWLAIRGHAAPGRFRKRAILGAAAGFSSTACRQGALTARATPASRRYGLGGEVQQVPLGEQQRLLHKASDYVKRYNILLLRYLREHPNA